MSELIQNDRFTEQTYQVNGFRPGNEDVKFSYTSARVGKPVYNTYEKNDYKVFGYFTDWCQYDSRLDSKDFTTGGRGRDLMNLDANAFDKIILGLCGIYGDNGEKKATIDKAAQDFQRSQWAPTFTDSWGDVLSYRNVGFNGWVADDVMPMFDQNKCQGILGGLRKLKQQNPNLGISISIGGWTMSEAFHGMCKDASKRSTFCTGVIDILNRFPMINELDIDWEYPNYPGYPKNQYGPEDVQNFAYLIKELKTALSKASKTVTISIACSAAPEGIRAANIPLLVESGVTNINLMTYDFFGTPWASKLAHHTNLNKDFNNTDQWSVDSAVDILIEYGIPAKNIFIGYAAYSRNAQRASVRKISPLNGTYDPYPEQTTVGTFESGSSEYYDIINNYLDLEAKSGKNGFVLYTDTVANADFLFSKDSQVFMSIDTPRSVKAKGEYVRSKGLGGLFTWTIDMDHGLLYNAAREGLGSKCTNQVIDMSNYYFPGRTN